MGLVKLIIQNFYQQWYSLKNLIKKKKLNSVFNLLKENEQNKNYITYESLSNAIKALNLKINEEEIKKCFKEMDNKIYLEDFRKLILEEEKVDKDKNIVVKDRKYSRTTSKNKIHYNQK
jgi:Ca2+-binding EF-hand superfamily protein